MDNSEETGVSGPGGASQAPRLAQWLRRATVDGGADDNRAAGVSADSPAGVDHHRTSSCARPEPIADQFAPQPELGRSPAFDARLRAGGQERPVGHTDCGQATGRAKVDHQTRPTRMVATGCVGDHDVGLNSQRAYCLLEQPTLAQGEEARGIKGVEPASDNRGIRHSSFQQHDSRRPGRIAALGRSNPAASARGEHRADAERPVLGRAP